MAIDQSQLTAALEAIVEPELGLPLGSIGLLREVQVAPPSGQNRAGIARGGVARI